MERLTKSNILVLRGVFMRDITAPRANKIVIKDTVYTVFPERYSTPEKWITHSNRKCYSCGRLFSTYPKFLPINPTKVDGRIEWEPEGNFCTWNCVAKYIKTNKPEAQWKDHNDHLSQVASEFLGRKVVLIMPSPDKTVMKQYCGSHGVTSEEYDRMIEVLNSNYSLTSYKIEHYGVKPTIGTSYGSVRLGPNRAQ